MKISHELYLTLVIIVLIPFGAFSQTLSIGGRIGPSFAKVSSSELDDFNQKSKIKPGLSLAVIGNYIIEGNFSIQGEISLTQKGYKSEDYGSPEKLNINYVAFEMLAKNTFGTESILPFLQGGAFFSRGLSGKYEYDDDVEKLSSKGAFFENEYEIGDYGIIIGGGAIFETEFGQLFFDIRYLFSLKDFYLDLDYHHRNRAFVVGVGVLKSI